MTSFAPAPGLPGGGALAPAAGAIGGGLVGGLFSGGKKEEKKEEKKEVPPPASKKAAREAAASSETVKQAEPVQASTQAAAVALDTAPAQAVSAAPLYSAGPDPKIAVVAFDGEAGPEFSAMLSAALNADLKVYSPETLAAKEYDPAAINRVSAKKIAAEIDVEYLVTGKVSKKTDTLSIVSISLRDGRTSDTKITDNHNIRSVGELPSAAENAAAKIKERIGQ